jgi:hypothetical protein
MNPAGGRESGKDGRIALEGEREGVRGVAVAPARARILQVSRGFVARTTPAEISAFTFRGIAMYPSSPGIPRSPNGLHPSKNAGKAAEREREEEREMGEMSRVDIAAGESSQAE